MIGDLYHDYPDDNRAILLYVGLLRSERELNRDDKEKKIESLLRKAANQSPRDPAVLLEFADYADINERLQLYANAVELTQEDELVSHRIELTAGYIKEFCSGNKKVLDVVDSIPARYKTDGYFVDPKNELAVKQLALDRQKLQALKKSYVLTLRQLQCSK